jgi:hypothetical protein
MITDHNFGPPFNLQVDHVTSRSFRVTWSEPSVRYSATLRIDNYKVQVFKESRTISNVTIDQARFESNSKLYPNSRYQVEVSAVVAGVQGPTADYFIQTNEDGEINTAIHVILYYYYGHARFISNGSYSRG